MLDNVWIDGCGKQNSDYHALSWILNNNSSSVTHSVISNSYSKCVTSENTNSVTLKNNLIVKCINMGINFIGTSTALIDSNI